MKVFEVIAYRQYNFGASAKWFGLIVDESEEKAREAFFKSEKGKEYVDNDVDESMKWNIDFFIREVDLTTPGVLELHSA